MNPLYELISELRASWTRKRESEHRKRRERSRNRRLMIEPLEGRRLLAIVWANEFGVNDFDIYGNDEVYARDMVNRAMDDWDRVITDFNYDGDTNPNTTNSLNDTYTLTINAATLASPTTRAQTAIPNFDPNGLPTDTTITMDNDAAGNGWFFDSTPLDDAEFTGIANSFQASFVDSTAEGQSNRDDFYRTITHEIGHALGIFIGFGAIDQFQSLLGSFPSGESLFSFNNPNGQFDTEVTFTSSGGGHFFEGPPPSNLPNLPVHPNELMNPGRTVPPPGADPIPTTRQFISDLTVQVLADAYGYTVTLPSTLDTAHATLDSLSGTLLVQGLPGAVNETITIDTVGDDIRVVVGNTTELIPQVDVTQIVVAGNLDTDTITVDPQFDGMTQMVDYVVSSNEDSADAGTLGDGLVDLDPLVPGNQTALRAAVRDANSASSGSIYLPQGTYNLTLTSGGEQSNASANDLDITGNVTIVGAGAGLSLIDASFGATVNNNTRVFEVRPTGDLDISRLTVTGGGATRVLPGAADVNNFSLAA